MEFLRDLLGEELYTQVSEKLSGNEAVKLANLADGKYIPKEKFDAERNTSKGLKSQIDELNSKITQLQGENSGVDALKAQLSSIQAEIAKKDAEMKTQRMNYSILDAARKHKAKDPDLMAKMVDLSKITEKDDAFIGIDEQFSELEKSYSYMFDSSPAPAGGFDPNQAQTGVTGNENSIMNQMIRGAAGYR